VLPPYPTIVLNKKVMIVVRDIQKHVMISKTPPNPRAYPEPYSWAHK